MRNLDNFTVWFFVHRDDCHLQAFTSYIPLCLWIAQPMLRCRTNSWSGCLSSLGLSLKNCLIGLGDGSSYQRYIRRSRSNATKPATVIEASTYMDLLALVCTVNLFLAPGAVLTCFILNFKVSLTSVSFNTVLYPFIIIANNKIFR